LVSATDRRACDRGEKIIRSAFNPADHEALVPGLADKPGLLLLGLRHTVMVTGRFGLYGEKVLMNVN
jgi:hypothetical protein